MAKSVRRQIATPDNRVHAPGRPFRVKIPEMPTYIAESHFNSVSHLMWKPTQRGSSPALLILTNWVVNQLTCLKVMFYGSIRGGVCAGVYV